MGNTEPTPPQKDDEFRRLLENLNDVVFEANLDGKIVYISQVSKTVLGFTPEEIVGRHYSAFIFKDDLPLVERAFRDILGGQIYPSDYRVVTKSGEIRWANSSSRPIMENGCVSGIRGRLTDITANKSREEEALRLHKSLESQVAERATQLNDIIQKLENENAERKWIEAALRESEQKFRTLFETAGDAIFIMEGDKFIDCNVRTLELFGCQARSQIVGHSPYEFSPPFQPNGRDSREFSLEKINAALSGTPQFFEWMHTKIGGARFSTEVSLNTIKLGGKVFLQAIVREITQRKQAETALRESEARFRSFVESAPDAIFVQNQGHFVYLNLAVLGLFDASRPEELLGMDIMERIAPEYREIVRERIHSQCETGKLAPPLEEIYLRLDGSRVPVEVTAVPIQFLGAASHLVFARDISERKRAEEALRQSDARFRSLVESAPEAIFVQIDRRFVYLNPAMLKLFGASRPEELLGRDLMDRMAPEYHESIRARIRFQRETGKQTPMVEQEYLRLDGSRVPVEATAVAIRYRGGDASMVFARDITERKRAEQERLRLERIAAEQQRLALLGQLSTGVAHEIRNPLQGAFSFLHLAKTAVRPEQSSLLESLDYVKEALKRIDAISVRMLKLGRGGDLVLAETELSGLLNGTLTFVKSRAQKAEVALTTEIEPGLKTAVLDSTRISEALLNLLNNALDATPPGGTVCVKALRAADGKNGLELRVSDTGCGMNAEVREKAFQPFFTTKAIGKGTGLGLALVQKIVEEHGGSVGLDSAEGNGTTISLFLPETRV